MRLRVIITILLVMFACQANAKEKSVKLKVSYNKDLLSVKADNTTVERLCKEITRKTSVEIVLLDKAMENQNVTVEFDNLSLKDGIGRIVVATGIKDMACTLFEKEVLNCQDMKFGRRLTQIGIGKGDAVLRHYKSLEKPPCQKSPPIIEGLDKVLAIAKDRNADKSERVRAMTKLDLLKPKDARVTIEGLVKCEKDPDIRALAAIILGSIGDRASIPVLREALRDKEKKVQLTAAHVLGCFHDDSGYNIVKDLVYDSSVAIRGYAISILGIIGKEKDKVLIEAALKDSDKYVQINAEMAQREMELKGTRGRVEFLKGVLNASSEDGIREWAVKKLSGEGEEGLKILKEIAGDPDSKGNSFAQMELKLINVRKDFAP